MGAEFSKKHSKKQTNVSKKSVKNIQAIEAYVHYLAGISKVVLENHFIDGPHYTCKICNATSERPWLHCA